MLSFRDGAETFIHEGLGNDDLVDDFRSDLNFGGAGNDRLLGGHGDDLLVGGTELDLLLGSLGDDILIGGDLDQTLTADELHEALDQWAADHESVAELEDGFLSDESFDVLFCSFGFDWYGVG